MTVYSSRLAPYISDLIAQKHLLGYSFAYGELALKWFDEFCSENYPQESTITRAMGLAWAVRRPTQITEYTLRKLIADGTIPSIKTGNKHLVNLDQVLSLFEPACVSTAE